MPSPFIQDMYADQWTNGSQPLPNSTTSQLGGALKFAAGLGVIGLAGQANWYGKPGWDYITNAVRKVEEYSPGRVFRTFQISHMLSPLETASKQYRYFSGADISRLYGDHTGAGRLWMEQVSRLTGRDMFASDIVSQGFRFEKGQLRLGKTGGETLLAHAGIMRSPTGAAQQFQQGYARSLAGGPLVGGAQELDAVKKAFGQRIPFEDIYGRRQAGEAMMFVGGKSRAQAAKRLAFGYGATLAERINQLARAPFEMEPFKSVFTKVPGLNKIRLGVVPSSGLKTIGKITGKLGILGTAAFMAYQTLDYHARESDTLDNTLFGEGISAGLSSLWTRGQVGISKVAETLGGHAYRESQEEIAPKSTQLGTLAAFPLMGAMGGLSISYMSRIRRQRALGKAGMSFEQAAIGSNLEDAFFRQALYETKIPSDLLTGASEKTLKLIEKQTQAKASGWMGRMSRKMPNFLARGKMSPTRLRWMLGAGIGLAVVAPFLPGALVPSTRPEELEKIYSGEQRVPIRKGRWWEFGRQPYEGTSIDRFRAHWYPRMLARAKEKSIWGEDAPSPFKKWITENFTYDLEKKHYEDRPYPVSGTAFEDIPFVGPILAATVGRLVKPAKLMHTEDWMGGEGGDSTVRMPLKYQQEDLSAMGEVGPGSPISPYGFKGTVGEQAYRLTEMVGLPGFTMTAIKEAITGTPDVFDQEMQLESARRMYGAERGLWDLDLGGGLGSTELLRRLYPHRRRQIEQYNPIRNTMPEWMPGPGERSPDFLHGDPYAKVPEGESRLPGEGYAALHPELKGVSPKDYPAIHRFAILGDIGAYTDKYKEALAQVREESKYGQLSAEDRVLYNQTLSEVTARKKRKEFSPYRYREQYRTPIQEMLAEVNEATKENKGPSWFEDTVGSYWENLTHNAETFLESLTPMSPASKLVHTRTAIEDYKKTQVYGTMNAFWGHPIRDFIKPTANSAAAAAGWEGIPESVREVRGLEEYFDILKYVKYTRLNRQARIEGDKSAAKEFESKRRETLFGINPYTYNYSHIYRALPRRDRDYFQAFADANMEERAEIMKAIPENEQALMMARWKLQDEADMQKAVKAGVLSEKQVAQSEEVLQDLFENKETEGMPKNKQLWAEYIATRLSGEAYPDWYRRVKLLPEALDGKSLPGPDWVGWCPSVDLGDIKLKIVEREGKNMYDYDLWPDRQRAVARRPFIAEAADEVGGEMNIAEIRRRISQVLGVNNVKETQITVEKMAGPSTNQVEMNIREDRDSEALRIYRHRGLN